MKKILFYLVVPVLTLVAAESASAQNCKPDADQVAIFTDPIYKGRCTVLGTGEYPNVVQQVLKHFSFSSIIVGQNVKVQVCEAPGLEGTCETFDKSGDAVGMSLKVFRRSDAPPRKDSSRNAGAVIFDTKTGMVIGGVKNGMFVDDKTASTDIRMDDSYSFYSLEEGGNSNKGLAKTMVFDDRCSVYTLEFAKGSGAIALSSNAKWNAVPRASRILDSNDQTYSRITREYLQSKGISDPVVEIQQLIRVDLEGDGQDEVVLSARHVETEEADIGETFKNGSYSFLIVRKIIAGKVETIVLGSEIYTKDISLQGWVPREREVTAIVDLNGDGVMEIVVHTTTYESWFTTVHKIKDGKAVEALFVGCGA